MVRKSFITSFFVFILLLAACSDDPQEVQITAIESSATTPIQEGDSTPVPVGVTEGTSLPVQVTETPGEPLAATVNDQPILLARYEKELERYRQAQLQLGYSETDLAGDYQTVVLDALIETELIAQAAEANGISITSEMVQTRLTELQELAGGQENFEAWLQTNQMNMQEFIEALATEMLTEKTVELITSDVPREVEQIHARYLQVDDEALAQSLLQQLLSGADFGTLAQEYSLDRITGENGGDLSYFARGSLLVAEIETAAFELQPGEISQVVPGPKADGSGTTYYIIQVIERDPQRALSADMLYKVLQERFEQWLNEQWDQAEIIRHIDT